MSKFRTNKSKEMPAVSTASLPDIVFIVLAFFIVVSSMKETDLNIKVVKPSGEETIVLDKNYPIDYIAAGKPKNSKAFGTGVVLQLDDDIRTDYLKIQEFINLKRRKRSDAEKSKSTTAIKADKDEVTMNEIDKIENELREIDALRVNYLTD